jgi:hypothetical protein
MPSSYARTSAAASLATRRNIHERLSWVTSRLVTISRKCRGNAGNAPLQSLSQDLSACFADRSHADIPQTSKPCRRRAVRIAAIGAIGIMSTYL